MAKMAKRVILY